ncbi:MAG TPA: glycosyltransferase family 1 protein [Candidatus Hydrogenedens sp.]|nr:glycosyltransferase family 4 protein [Candidatus Hydrogenedens sp.]HOK09686.1 glycosyltransferase family 1 protein [Candidatus Hydrogenedens sp.]HOL19275.1 glycosyltransferase family 1 protein [Candidatus Hydrogenedens sp.]HPP59228.1 glycosyltransferase family 1 protein [Candidatus Hydrogenedens sp.]
MRILLNGFQIGNLSGTGRYTEELVKAFIQIPNVVHIFLSSPKPLNIPSEKLTINPLPNNRYITRLLQKHLLKKHFQKSQPDIVHFPATYGYKLGDIPHITTVHDLAFLNNPNWFPPHYRWFYKRRVEETIKFSQRFITDSYFSKRELQKYYNIDKDKIDVIYLGVSDFFKPHTQQQIETIRNKYKLPPKYVLYAGTLEPRKNIPYLIEAWSYIADKIPHHLVIIGRTGWNTYPIEEAIKKSKFNERIHRLGYISDIDLPVIISGAEIFIYLSFYEGFGLPPLEAMSCGTPVIASNCGSLNEILEDTALLVEPSDIQQIAEAIYNLCEDNTKRQVMSHNGIIHAQKFTWEKTAQKTIEAYKKCLGKY